MIVERRAVHCYSTDGSFSLFFQQKGTISYEKSSAHWATTTPVIMGIKAKKEETLQTHAQVDSNGNTTSDAR